MTQSSCRWVLALATVLWAARSAQADDLVQAPQLAAPQRGSLAGEYGNVAFGPADVDRGRVLALDRAALDAWWGAIGMGAAGEWRAWPRKELRWP